MFSVKSFQDKTAFKSNPIVFIDPIGLEDKPGQQVSSISANQCLVEKNIYEKYLEGSSDGSFKALPEVPKSVVEGQKPATETHTEPRKESKIIFFGKSKGKSGTDSAEGPAKNKFEFSVAEIDTSIDETNTHTVRTSDNVVIASNSQSFGKLAIKVGKIGLSNKPGFEFTPIDISFKGIEVKVDQLLGGNDIWGLSLMLEGEVGSLKYSHSYSTEGIKIAQEASLAQMRAGLGLNVFGKRIALMWGINVGSGGELDAKEGSFKGKGASLFEMQFSSEKSKVGMIDFDKVKAPTPNNREIDLQSINNPHTFF